MTNHFKLPQAAAYAGAAFLWLTMTASAQQTPTLDAAAALMAAGNFEEAREAFEGILKSDPNNTEASDGEVAAGEQLALEQRSRGEKDGALRDLLRARAFAPHNGRLLYDLGVLEDEMLLYKDADGSLTAAELLMPDDLRLLYARARVKLDLGQLGPAEEKMRAYLKVRPDDASAHYGMGRVYQLALKFDEARVEFRRSIELHPLQTEAYYQLGDMAVEQGAFDDATLNFQKTLSRDPRHGGALTGMGEVYFKQKKYDKALEFLRDAVAAAPDYQPGHYFLGLTLARLGQAEESRRELASATRLADAEHGKNSRRLEPSP